MDSLLSVAVFVLDILKFFRKYVITQIVVAIIWAMTISFRPYLIKVMLDKMQTLQLYTAFELLWPAILYIIIFILTLFTFRFYEYMRLNFVPNIKKQIGLKVMERMMKHSHQLYQNKLSGDISNKINDLITSIPTIIQISIDRLFSHILALVIAVYTLYQVNVKFSLAMILWTLLFLIFSFKISYKAKILADETASARSAVFGHIVDIISNIMSVRLFTGKAHEYIILDNCFSGYIQTEKKMGWFFLKAHSLQGGLFIVLQSFCLCSLISGLNNQSITPGDFALVLTLNLSISDCLWGISQDFREFTNLVGNISNALQLVQSPIQIQDRKTSKEVIINKGKIVFENVSFGYQNIEPLFENKSITIFPGQKVGLVGYSGSGKTTFINLILRLFEVTGGRILIDGYNINDITQESLRKSIALIPQDPHLFHRSVMDNIRYGKVDASDKKVIEAAKLAYAHDFIIKLPNKYESLVGERGVKLSGGQRQRIAIARAILKNAPILILDEATSQLDSLTEVYLQKSLYELMENKTTIVIAHRLSTLLHMDRILVFNEGCIVEDGNHQELLAINGIYKTLWSAQVNCFL